MRRILLVTVAATCLMCNKVETVSENEAIFEQSDVFVGGQDGIFEYRIPVLVTSNKGTLLAFCDARVEQEGDPPNNIDLALKRSFDDGKTWGPLQRLWTPAKGRWRIPAAWSIAGRGRSGCSQCTVPPGSVVPTPSLGLPGHLHVLGRQERRRRRDLVRAHRHHSHGQEA